MSKTTPGPWTVAHEEDDLLVMNGALYVAKVYRYAQPGDDTGQKTAQLVAAAPDLRDALREFVSLASFSPESADDCDRFSERLRAAESTARALLERLG